MDEINAAGVSLPPHEKFLCKPRSVRQAAKARKESFASANPLSLGGGGPRGGNIKTPISWLTGKLGVGV